MITKIKVLKGPERVRLRPSVVFRSDDDQGVLEAVQMVLNVLSRECFNGHSDRIMVTRYMDGSVELRDYGRGIYFGEDDTIWKALFCELYAAPRDMPYLIPADLCSEGEAPSYEIDLCCVQYASRYMDVQVIREGRKYILHFEEGENKNGLRQEPCEDQPGTCIRFLPDSQVFSDIFPDADVLAMPVQFLAVQIPGLTALFCQETEDGFAEQVYYYPKGIEDYLRTQNSGHCPVYTARLAKGQEELRLGLCFGAHGFVTCFHNGKHIAYGGTHRDAFLERVTGQLSAVLDCAIHPETLQDHLQVVILTNTDKTYWQNASNQSIENHSLRDLAVAAAGDELVQYFTQNQALLHSLFESQ